MSVSSDLIALHCIVRREVSRILRLWLQTLVPPAVSTALYFAIFGKLIGDRIGSVDGGSSYLQFITPGLVLSLAHPLVAVLSALLAATIFSLLGFINALYAKTLDDIGHVSHYVLTPLAYLGGVFYPISLLDAPWQAVAQVNPLAHMIGTFRYGVLGTGAPGFGLSIAVMLGLTLGLSALALVLLRRGVGTRS